MTSSFLRVVGVAFDSTLTGTNESPFPQIFDDGAKLAATLKSCDDGAKLAAKLVCGRVCGQPGDPRAGILFLLDELRGNTNDTTTKKNKDTPAFMSCDEGRGCRGGMPRMGRRPGTCHWDESMKRSMDRSMAMGGHITGRGVEKGSKKFAGLTVKGPEQQCPRVYSSSRLSHLLTSALMGF